MNLTPPVINTNSKTLITTTIKAPTGDYRNITNISTRQSLNGF